MHNHPGRFEVSHKTCECCLNLYAGVVVMIVEVEVESEAEDLIAADENGTNHTVVVEVVLCAPEAEVGEEGIVVAMMIGTIETSGEENLAMDDRSMMTMEVVVVVVEVEVEVEDVEDLRIDLTQEVVRTMDPALQDLLDTAGLCHLPHRLHTDNRPLPRLQLRYDFPSPSLYII